MFDLSLSLIRCLFLKVEVAEVALDREDRAEDLDERDVLEREVRKPERPLLRPPLRELERPEPLGRRRLRSSVAGAAVGRL